MLLKSDLCSVSKIQLEAIVLFASVLVRSVNKTTQKKERKLKLPQSKDQKLQQ